MMHIENLRICLPGHLQPHAEYIIHRVAEYLSGTPILHTGSIDILRIPPIKSRAGDTPDDIARAISYHLISSIKETSKNEYK